MDIWREWIRFYGHMERTRDEKIMEEITKFGRGFNEKQRKTENGPERQSSRDNEQTRDGQ